MIESIDKTKPFYIFPDFSGFLKFIFYTESVAVVPNCVGIKQYHFEMFSGCQKYLKKAFCGTSNLLVGRV